MAPTDPDPPADPLRSQVYDELRAMAQAGLRRLAPGQTLQATALVHEAWLRLQQRGVDHGRFFGAAAQAMRDVLVERVRARLAHKRGGDRRRDPLDDIAAIEPPVGIADVLALDDVLLELQQQHPDEAEVVMRRFFAGQTHADIAVDLQLSERTVERRWRFARAFLARRLGGLAALEDA